LAAWKAELPPQIRVKRKEEIIEYLEDPSVFSPLSTVITLRYLNVRTLLHRSMVARFLDYDGQDSGGSEEWSFLQEFGRTSLEVSVRSATEMIAIIYTASEGRHRMLTTWWFSIYYSQYPKVFASLSTDRFIVFSSALIVFAAMVIKHKQGLQISGFESGELASSLQRALQALENLGDDTRIATRCRKNLKKLVHVASTISMCPLEACCCDELSDKAGNIGTTPHVISGMSPNARHGSIDGIAVPVSDFSEFSPLDLDLGPFVAGNDWDIFTQSMDQEYLGLTFPKETVHLHQ
jgi:hypothetical protein